jgi:hypothetical protein
MKEEKSFDDEISFDNIPSRCAKLINFDVGTMVEEKARSLSLYHKFLMQFIMIAVGDLHSIIALKCPGCLLHIISIKSLLLIFIYGPTCVVGAFFFLLIPAVIRQKSTPVSECQKGSQGEDKSATRVGGLVCSIKFKRSFLMNLGFYY